MGEFAVILTETWNIMNIEFQVFGHTVSFSQVFAYTTVGSILLSMVWEVFFDG